MAQRSILPGRVQPVIKVCSRPSKWRPTSFSPIENSVQSNSCLIKVDPTLSESFAEPKRHAEPTASSRIVVGEVCLLMMLFFVYAGDPPPMVNEAHYLVKAKNFWDPQWCSRDLFAASGKAHTTFYALFGWPSRYTSLEVTAWIGRAIAWLMLALGLRRLSWRMIARPWICVGVAALWIAGIERGNLAGEWVVGGIEAKVPAYALVLWALAEMVGRRWDRTWIALGTASAFSCVDRRLVRHCGQWSPGASPKGNASTDAHFSHRHCCLAERSRCWAWFQRYG